MCNWGASVESISQFLLVFLISALLLLIPCFAHYASKCPHHLPGSLNKMLLYVGMLLCLKALMKKEKKKELNYLEFKLWKLNDFKLLVLLLVHVF